MIGTEFVPESEYQVPILVVDDTRDNLDLMEALLIGEGYQDVILVDSGEAALQAVKENNEIGLILLDLMMPGMSGYEVCSYIVNDPQTQDIPVIAVTGGGYIQNEALEKSFMAGAVDYIPKPINEVELFARVKVGIQLYLERRMRKFSSSRTVESEERFRAIFQEAPVGIAHLDQHQNFITTNSSFQKLLGRGADKLIGESWTQFVASAEDQDNNEALTALVEGEKKSAEVVLQCENGDKVWANLYLSVVDVPLEDSPARSYILIAENITEKKFVEDKMREMAYYDGLTQLPNREFFNAELNRAISLSQNAGAQFAVLYFDLDYFKTINDSLGHEVGDSMLREVSVAVQECIRDSDILARLGGDEFALLLPRTRSPKDACIVAQKILDRLQSPLKVDDHEFYAGVSIGVSFYPQDGEDARSLLKNADIAMYRAKELGRQNYQLFNPSMDKTVERRLDLEQDLRRAIKENEFTLHYQPQIDPVSNAVIGLEALVRWQHPERGILGPFEFLPLAEETGLILSLGEQIIRDAIQQTKQWQSAGVSNKLIVSVNLSLRQFQQHGLVDFIAKELDEAGLSPASFGVEVTESINSLDKDLIINSLNNFRSMGIHASIDDFGMGYSSLSHLRRFPLDGLKVDRSFVEGAIDNAEDKAILQTIVSLGKSLSLKVIAEGVETEAQRDLVVQLGCDAIQGYFYSKPIPAVDVLDWLNKNKSAA